MTGLSWQIAPYAIGLRRTQHFRRIVLGSSAAGAFLSMFYAVAESNSLHEMFEVNASLLALSGNTIELRGDILVIKHTARDHVLGISDQDFVRADELLLKLVREGGVRQTL
ncbi:hypothetical protein EXIGLDRAFT_780882 [Exidia glandulosa HHB12029]|uniref:Uncharacterized protein n=1 Tax=Exidia glandulosa HHB12029 TaxID=1314781 RepID=A0A165BEZ6_EXIGL|nr:hypothetical protein EXIGLDRAFT_780882 [Exidia glandulosa HHB12029]